MIDTAWVTARAAGAGRFAGVARDVLDPAASGSGYRYAPEQRRAADPGD